MSPGVKKSPGVKGSPRISPGMSGPVGVMYSSGSKPGGGAGGAPTVSGVTGVLTGLDGTRPSEFQNRTQLQFDSTNFDKSSKDVIGCTT